MTLTDQDALEELAVAVYGHEPPACQLTEGIRHGPPCAEPATHRAIFDCRHDNLACARHAAQLRASAVGGLMCVGEGYKRVPMHPAHLIRVVPI